MTTGAARTLILQSASLLALLSCSAGAVDPHRRLSGNHNSSSSDCDKPSPSPAETDDVYPAYATPAPAVVVAPSDGERPDSGGDGNGGDDVTSLVYLGCYDEAVEITFFSFAENDNMTHSMCFHHCAAESALYLGLLRGNLCSCGDDPTFLDAEVVEAVCDEPCTGDAFEMCGGDQAYDLFELVDEVQTSEPAPAAPPVVPTPHPVTDPDTPAPIYQHGPVTPPHSSASPVGGGDSEDVCSNGIPGIQTGHACCLAECGVCGGPGCAELGGGLGEENCCQSSIEEGGDLCSIALAAPCVVDDAADGPAPSPVEEYTASPTSAGGVNDSLCSNGIPGIQSGDVCCLAECGGCGGPGCGELGGGLGAENCCESEIEVRGHLCSFTFAAPCVVDDEDLLVPSSAEEHTASPTPSEVVNEYVCSNGIPGIQSGDACCSAECGACGGPGCGELGGGLGADSCCQSEIEEFGELCSVTFAAPCVVDDEDGPAPSPADEHTASPTLSDLGDDSVCSNGIPGIQSGDSCCLAECGECGGPGCAQFGGDLGAENCCQVEIRDFGELCSVALAAPCVVDGEGDDAPAPSPVVEPTAPPAPTAGSDGDAPAPSPIVAPTASPATTDDANDGVCNNGIPGVQSGDACCLAECGTCGGPGCSELGGGLGADNCCQSEIEDFGELCSVTLASPCVVDDEDGDAPAPSPVVESTASPVTADGADGLCSNGIPGIQSGQACCPNECGACGGLGCGLFGDGLGAHTCCQSEIEDLGHLCSVTLAAPCVVDDEEGDPAPSPAAPTPTESEAPTPASSSAEDTTEPTAPTPTEPEAPTPASSSAGDTTEPEAPTPASSSAGHTVEPVSPTDGGDGGVCSNGVPGIQSGHACCLAECGECGGPGCDAFGGGLGAENCCQSEIEDFAELCSVTLAAPCAVDEDGDAPAPSPVAAPTAPTPTDDRNGDVCSNGIPGIQSGDACCLAECGACGGPGCSELGGGLGADNCCQSEIEDFGELCSITHASPCVVDDEDGDAPAPSPVVEPTAAPTVADGDSEYMCSNGIPGIQSGNACCPAECGACGGPDCALLGGGLGADVCCQSEIEDEGELCSVALAAPCAVCDGSAAPTPAATGAPTAAATTEPAPVSPPTVATGAPASVSTSAPTALTGTQAPAHLSTSAPTALAGTPAPAHLSTASPTTLDGTEAPVHASTAAPTALPGTQAPAQLSTAAPTTLPATTAPASAATATPTAFVPVGTPVPVAATLAPAAPVEQEIPFVTSQPVQDGGEGTSGGVLEFIIPLYTAPFDFDGELVSQWALLNRTAAAGKRAVGIVNPSNGPGDYDELYVAAMDKVMEAGAKLICYVPTGFGATEERNVTDDVFAYNAQYPGYCDGIFFDETPTFLEEYLDLYTVYNAAVHTIFDAGGNETRVMFNPGVSADDTYYTGFSPTVEVVGFENSYDSFDEAGIVPDTSGNSTVGSNIFLVHSASALAADEGLIPEFVRQCYCKGWDSIYVTDDVLPNPFDVEPTFWDAVLTAEGNSMSC